MGAAFTAYMSIKGLKKIMKIEAADVILYALIAFVICWLLSRPFIAKRVANLIDDSKKQIYTLFNLPLIIGCVCFHLRMEQMMLDHLLP